MLRTPHPKRGTWIYRDLNHHLHFAHCPEPEQFKAHRRADDHWCYQHPADARQRV